MLHELASTEVVVSHHARMHVTGQMVVDGDSHRATIVVERGDGSAAAPVDLTSSVDSRDVDRYLINVRGDTRDPLAPGAYRVKLLADRATRVVLARVGHVLLSTCPSDDTASRD